MQEIGWLFLFGILFGLGATLPPGPINTEIARRTLKYGLLPGLAFGLGSIFVENVLAVIACMGYGLQINSHRAILPVMLFVGFMVLSIMGTFALVNGYRAWHNPAAVHPVARDGEDVAALRASPGLLRTQLVSTPRSFFAGLGMAIISPYTLVFWIVALPSAAHDAIEQQSPQIWVLLLGILVGTGGWIAMYTAMLAWLKRYSTNWWEVWADLIGGVMLLVFAALTLLKLATTLLKMGGGARPSM